MNSVTLIGRLTRDPDIKYSQNNMCIASFSVAIDRPVKSGEEKKTDFPRVTCFGKTAENCQKYLAKGRLVGVLGRIQTGSYENKDGVTVYTTDVVADRVEFLEWGDKKQGTQASSADVMAESKDQSAVPDGMANDFAQIDEDVPF